MLSDDDCHFVWYSCFDHSWYMISVLWMMMMMLCEWLTLAWYLHNLCCYYFSYIHDYPFLVPTRKKVLNSTHQYTVSLLAAKHICLFCNRIRVHCLRLLGESIPFWFVLLLLRFQVSCNWKTTGTKQESKHQRVVFFVWSLVEALYQLQISMSLELWK